MTSAAPAQTALRDAIASLLQAYIVMRLAQLPRGLDSLRLVVCEAVVAGMSACAFALGHLRAEPRIEIVDAVTRDLPVLAAAEHRKIVAARGHLSLILGGRS